MRALPELSVVCGGGGRVAFELRRGPARDAEQDQRDQDGTAEEADGGSGEIR